MKPHIEFHAGKWRYYQSFWHFTEKFSATTLRILAQKAQQNEDVARVGEQQNCVERRICQ